MIVAPNGPITHFCKRLFITNRESRRGKLILLFFGRSIKYFKSYLGNEKHRKFHPCEEKLYQIKIRNLLVIILFKNDLFEVN